MEKQLQLELYIEGSWHTAASTRLFGPPRRTSSTRLEYDFDHSLQHLDAAGLAAVSVRFPVDFTLHELATFPSFAIDLMPQGEARRLLEARLRRAEIPQNDWTTLLHGAGSPTGNLRVAAAARPPIPDARGVPREIVIQRGDTYREWAESQDIPMTGSTDTGGAAPKLLLTEDDEGLLHADGVLPDARARRHWLIKFPRGRTRRDHQVLACEPAWLEIARRLGLRCGGALEHFDGSLFVPRFDRRVAADGVARYGMESAYSVLGVVEAGARLRHEDVCTGIATAVDDPAADVEELVLRDALSIALGDTDNHGRNTALLKTPAGVAVSPLFDCAPMCLDPEGITRATRWDSERPGGVVDWPQVVAATSAWVAPAELTERLLEMADGLAAAPDWMREFDVEDEIVELITPKITKAIAALRRLET